MAKATWRCAAGKRDFDHKESRAGRILADELKAYIDMSVAISAKAADPAGAKAFIAFGHPRQAAALWKAKAWIADAATRKSLVPPRALGGVARWVLPHRPCRKAVDGRDGLPAPLSIAVEQATLRFRRYSNRPAEDSGAGKLHPWMRGLPQEARFMPPCWLAAEGR